jgi:hypothetical protein
MRAQVSIALLLLLPLETAKRDQEQKREQE